MNKKILFLEIIILLIVLFSGCTEQTQQSNPIGEIITQYTSANNDYDNFVIYVNMTIQNNGDAGELTAWAYVRQGFTDDEKRQTLFFDYNEIKSISFAFSEGFELGSSWFHDVGVTS